MATRVSEVKVPSISSLVLEIIMGLVEEPMSPAVAVREMVPPVMVMLVVLVIAGRERTKFAPVPVPVLVQLGVSVLEAAVQELMSLVIAGVAVVMVTAPVPYI